MSISGTMWLNCDGCGETFGDNVVRTMPTALLCAKIKLSATQNGWIRTGGKDLCTDCSSSVALGKKHETPTGQGKT